MTNSDLITGQYLAGTRAIEIPAVRRKPNKKRMIKLTGATGNNLRMYRQNFRLA